jgi:hypothetical protein
MKAQISHLNISAFFGIFFVLKQADILIFKNIIKYPNNYVKKLASQTIPAKNGNESIML